MNPKLFTSQNASPFVVHAPAPLRPSDPFYDIGKEGKQLSKAQKRILFSYDFVLRVIVLTVFAGYVLWTQVSRLPF